MNFESRETHCSKANFARAAFLVAAVIVTCLALPVAIRCQPSTAKIYRGSVGDKYIEMRLNIQGSNVTGTYRYDSIGEDLIVSGKMNGLGGL